MASPLEAEDINAVDDDTTVGYGTIFMAFLKLCAGCCYITCPPVPEIMTRKLAFHPPKRGSSYRILRTDEPFEEIEDAAHITIRESEGQSATFSINPVMILKNATARDYDEVMKYIEPFTVKTAFRNHLIVVRCRPKKISRHPRINQQVILFVQPNSSDIGSFLYPSSVNLAQMADVFETELYAFDYSGYGYSTGRPSEKNVYADTRAVYDHIRMERPDKKIVILGYSLGTSAAVHLSSTRPSHLAGVILLAPFTSGMRLFGRNPYREKACCMDRFTSIDRVASIDVPVLICHGTEDNVIPYQHGVALHDRLSHPVSPLLIYGADHQSIFTGEYPQTYSRIYKFLRCETSLDLPSTSGAPFSRSDNRQEQKHQETV